MLPARRFIIKRATGARDQEGARQIGLQDSVPVLEAHAEDQTVAGNPRVVDQGVDRARLGDHGLDRGPHHGLVGDVAGYPLGGAAAGRRRGETRGFLGLAAREVEDPASLGREELDDGASDALRAPGNDAGLAGQ